MEYNLILDGETAPVEVETEGEGKISVTIDGVKSDVAYSVIGEHRIRLVIEGKAVDVFVTGDSSGKSILIGGESFLVADKDAAGQPSFRKVAVGSLPDVVTAPIPSVVVSVAVSEGDRVDKGQAVMVVSAMKMETTLRAPYSGTVIRVNAGEGDKVMPGHVLVDIERDEDGEGEHV